MSTCSGTKNSVHALALQGATIILELAEDQVYAANQLVAGGLFDEYVLTGADFTNLGPGIVDIVIHAEGTNFTANFNYDVRLQYKFKYGAWSDVSLLGLRTIGDYVIGTAFTDRTKLGMQIRLVLRTQSSGGTVQRGNLTIAAAIRMYNGS